MPTTEISSKTILTWSAYEHEHIERESDWYWALGVAAVCIALTAIIFHDTLFGLLILLAATTIGMLAREAPPLTTFEISDRGIKVNHELHRFDDIIAFWIDEQSTPPLLLVDTTKPLAPNLIIPLHDVHHEVLRDFLLAHLSGKRCQPRRRHRLYHCCAVLPRTADCHAVAGSARKRLHQPHCC